VCLRRRRLFFYQRKIDSAIELAFLGHFSSNSVKATSIGAGDKHVFQFSSPHQFGAERLIILFLLIVRWKMHARQRQCRACRDARLFLDVRSSKRREQPMLRQAQHEVNVVTLARRQLVTHSSDDVCFRVQPQIRFCYPMKVAQSARDLHKIPFCHSRPEDHN
jgi:hypothetical protein